MLRLFGIVVAIAIDHYKVSFRENHWGQNRNTGWAAEPHPTNSKQNPWGYGYLPIACHTVLRLITQTLPEGPYDRQDFVTKGTRAHAPSHGARSP